MRHIHFIASQIKLVLFLALILLVLFLIQIAVVEATLETVVKVEPCASFADVGENFTINITVLDVQNLYGLEVNLYWNASILQLLNVDIRLGVESRPDGVLHESLFNMTREGEGKYDLAATSIAPAPSFNGSGNIVRFTFNVTNSGNSKLDLETQLYDYPPLDREPRISLPIEHTTIDGFFEIIPEFSNVIILFLCMALTIFAITFSKKIPRKT